MMTENREGKPAEPEFKEELMMATYEYELRFGDPRNYAEARIVKTKNLDYAVRMFQKAVQTAEREGLIWTVALWERLPNVPRAWLIQSTTTR